ncbi:flavin reductase family protein [Bordetella sp. BOR01]|nr:flavin reductase family protein [Bordetella sp. BOR01]
MDATAFPASMLNSIIAPRPIGWISSMSAAGQVNLAPFSYFNAISSKPPMLMFTCNKALDRPVKDTLANVRQSGEFVYNFVSFELREQMNRSSAPLPHGADEFEFASLSKAPSVMVRPPRVADAPVNLECKVVQIVDLDPDCTGEISSSVIIGRVVGSHVRREFIDAQGRFDLARAAPLTRLGGFAYSELGTLFDIPRPKFP